MNTKQEGRPKFQTVREEIEWHKKNKSNVLIPMTKIDENEFFKPVIDEVFLSPAEKDVYDRGKKNYAPTFQGLSRLSVCAGLQWHPDKTRRTDPGTDRLYISFEACGGVRKADGTMIWHSANYDLDLEVVKEEIEEGHRKNTFKKDAPDWVRKKTQKEKEEYVEWATTRDFRQKRRHKHALCETGAKSRVIRSILGLKNTYSADELQRPFIVIRYVLTPPSGDKAVKQFLLEQALNSAGAVYGQQQHRPPAIPYAGHGDTVIDLPPSEDLDPKETDPVFTSMDPEQWTQATQKEKLAEIRRIADYVKYDLKALESRADTTLEKMSDPQIDKLFNNLNETASDYSPPDDDDIPY